MPDPKISKEGDKRKRKAVEDRSKRAVSAWREKTAEHWVKEVKIVDRKPRDAKELQFMASSASRNFVILEEVAYQGREDRKPHRYWAKSVRDPEKEGRFIDAQAQIALFLADHPIPGIWKPKRFLEVRENGGESFKMILCEGFPRGATLFQRLCHEWQGGIREEKALAIMGRLGRTVQALHEVSVFHWDISAKNVWVTDGGETILFDWDFAFRSAEEFLERELWRCGTPHYLSRQRLEAMEKGFDSSECTLPTDAFPQHEAYSLIAMLVHMLIGNTFLQYGNHFGLPYNEHASLGRRLLEGRVPGEAMSPRMRRLLGEALEKGESPFPTVDGLLSALKRPA